jgi:membrane-associated phospholipid phosphatase
MTATALLLSWGHGLAAALRRLAGLAVTLTRRLPLTAWFLWTALFSLFSYELLDQPLALFCKAHLQGYWEGFFKIVTDLGEANRWIFPGLAVWGWCWWWQRRSLEPVRQERLRSVRQAASYFVLSMAASGVFVNLAKFAIGRLRPRLLFEQGLYGFQPFNTEWSSNSFPSGHSQAAFAAMTALAIILPRYDIMWLALAVLVAVSRVATSVHYLSDAVMGSYLGIAGAILLRRVYAARGISPRLRFDRDRRLEEE